MALWTDALFAGILALVVAERLGELWYSRGNARRLREAGALEARRDVYRWLVALHALFVPALAAEYLWAPWAGWWELSPLLLVAFVAAQAMRYWAIATLGRRWTTRVLVLPEAPPVTTGPYRYLRHPNYLAVVVELAAIPLAFGLWLSAVAFTAANALLLARRIRAEERALERAGDYRRWMGARGRLVPRPPERP